MRKISWGRGMTGLMVAALGATSLTIAVGQAAQAAPVYEITGQWVAPASQLASGELVTAEWRFNLNDDAAAATNDPVENVTATFTASNGTFARVPDICLTSGVNPVSSLSSDAMTLVCNVGAKDKGTAVVVQTPMKANGEAGAAVSADGAIGGQSATVPEIPIVNPFAMDIVWGSPTSYFSTAADQTKTTLDFEWTLNWAPNGSVGPDSVSYDVKVANTTGAAISVAPQACSPYSSGVSSGHPWSGGTHPASQMASFVSSCTLTPKAGSPGTFTLTLTGIDYSQALRPTQDSTGAALPSNWAAVASGSVWFSVATGVQVTSSTSLTSNAPTYTALDGSTSADDAANNSSDKPMVPPGSWPWGRWERRIGGGGGSDWDNTFKAAPGFGVVAVSASTANDSSMSSLFVPTDIVGVCSVLDTKYVVFDGSADIPTNLVDPSKVNMEYYIGADPSVDPNSASYDPQNFDCGVGGQGPGGAGWTTTKPTDLSTVKALRAQWLYSDFLPGAIAMQNWTAMYVGETIKSSAVNGQDIWTFSSYRLGTQTPVWTPRSDPSTGVTPTPGDRYPFTTFGRDVVTVVAATPSISKSADRAVAEPGVPVNYTLRYQALGRVGGSPVDGLSLVDTLPAGMSYVEGSAAPEPVVSTSGSQQVLTWTLNGVEVNSPKTLSYQAVLAPEVTTGKALVNSVTASLNGVRQLASAQVTVSSNGYTQIGKTTDWPYIPNLSGDGVGDGSWTVTLKSFDPIQQSATDTIDILPYNGDGRGTSFSGSYAVTGVTGMVAGATVYYTSSDPTTLSDDPADPSNGVFGDVTANTVGWTVSMPEHVTAVRVIGPALSSGGVQSFKIGVHTTAMQPGDVLMNRAQDRTSHTQLVTRASAPLTMANSYSASLKKYVLDPNDSNPDTQWHDANDVTDYVDFQIGSEVTYKIVVRNAGQGALTNIVVTDDKFGTGDFTIASLPACTSETDAACQFEKVFTVVPSTDLPGTVINTACATADTPSEAQEPVVIDCDPAGINEYNYSVKKSSDPVEGSRVTPGQTVRYTVTVVQEGTAPADAVFVDDLAEVLDDADYNGDVSASVGTVSVTDGVLSWAGTVPVGATATITYSVTVKAYGLGDSVLDNVVSSPGCVPTATEDEDCRTTNYMGWFTISKTSDPAPGAEVEPGDKITYQIVVTHHGEIGIGASLTDDLSGVLDQAVWSGDVVASSGTASISGNTLSWNGDLAVGQVVTISYSVVVKPEAAGTLVNVAVPGDEGFCVPAPDQNPDCTTTHPIPGLNLVKYVETAKGTDQWVTAPGVGLYDVGDNANFRLVVSNTGETTLKNVVVTDPLAPACDAVIPSLPSGGTYTVGCSMKVSKDVTNVATASDGKHSATSRAAIKVASFQPLPSTGSDSSLLGWLAAAILVAGTGALLAASLRRRVTRGMGVSS